jgi:hypothetical protein
LAGEVLRIVLALTIRLVGRLHENAGAVRPGVLAMRASILDPNEHRVRHLSASRRPTIATDVAHDDRAVAGPQLGTVILADP